MTKKIKRLVVFPSDPIDVIIEMGQSYLGIEEYFNPGDFFDEVYCLTPWKSKRKSFGKVKCITARPIQFKACIERIMPDVVRAYGGYHCADFAAMSRVKGIPVIVSLHDVRKQFMFKSVECADAVICMSEAVKTAALNHLNLNTENIWIMPNRIDTQVFAYRHDDIKFQKLNQRFGTGKHILHVGRKAEEKNLDTVIKALSILENDYICIFIGRGDIRQYQRLAEECGVLNRCYFVKSVKNIELPVWYSWCDCMCTPSRCEGFGFVFIEAAACEAAIVTSNIGPMNEYLNADSAILVDEFENEQAVADAIREATSGSEKIKIMRKNARNVGMLFSKEKIDAQEVEIYKKVMKMSSNDRSVNRLNMLWKYRHFYRI